MTTPSHQYDARKTHVTLSRQKRREFKRLLLDIEEDEDFPIELKESHCLEAAVDLILQASTPERISAEAKEQDFNEEETKVLEQSYEWFMDRFREKLRGVIDERIASDKRRPENRMQ